MEAPETGNHRLRVLTLNLWGRAGVWEARRRVLIDGLRTLRPDLIAFQESVLTDNYNQVGELLGSEYQIAHQAARQGDGMGVSIASRWPIRKMNELDLLTPRTGELPCTTLADLSAREA